MSTSGRNRTYWSSKMRVSMLRAAVDAIDAAMSAARMDCEFDPGTGHRLKELHARCVDEVSVAEKSLQHAEADL